MSESRINLPAKIFPTGPFETHEDIYGKGGFVVLNDELGASAADDFINERITYQRRKEGMLVYISSDNSYYKCSVTGSSVSEGRWSRQYFSGRYFQGPSAPTASDLVLGEKWFNTTVGSEFTYLYSDEDQDSYVWVDIDHLGQGETGFVRISGDIMTGALTGPNASFVGLNVSSGFIGVLTGTNASFTGITATNGFIGVLTGTNASFTGITATNGFIGVLTGTNASFTKGSFDQIITSDLTASNQINAGRGFRTNESPVFEDNEFITKQFYDENSIENNNLITNGNFLTWQRGKQFRYLADTRVRNQAKKQIGFNYFNVCHHTNYYGNNYSFIEGRFRREFYNYNRMFSAAADRWVFGWENSDFGVTYPDVSVTGSGFYVYRGFVNSDDQQYLNNSTYFCRISTSPPPSFSWNRSDSPSEYPYGIVQLDEFQQFSSIRNDVNLTSPGGLTYGAIINHLTSDDRPPSLRSATADMRRITDIDYVDSYFDPYNTCIPITGDTDIPGTRAKIRDNYWAGFSQTISYEDFKDANFGNSESNKNLYLRFYARSNTTGKYSITFTNGGPKTLGVEEYTNRGRINSKSFYITTPNEWKEYEVWCEPDLVNGATGGLTTGCWDYPSKSPADPGIQINWCLGSSPAIGAEELKFTDVAAGFNHTLAVRDDGTLWSWGRNTFGQLGLGNTSDVSSPRQVGSDTGWTGVACGVDHSVAIKSNGTLWSWGNNGLGQLGLGNTAHYNTPQQIGGDTNWEKVSCGAYFTIAIKTTGTMWSWGEGTIGQLGLGTYGDNYYSPQQIGSDTNWESVSCGGYHAIGIKTTGTMWSWGSNEVGQLGLDNSIQPVNTPQQIGSDNNWSKVSCGTYHSIATKDTGTMWSWGNNIYGQLGIGTSGLLAYEEAPVQIEFPEGGNIPDDEWVEPFCGINHSLAIRQDGTLWSWGDNEFGQLGLSENISQLNNPVPVGGTWTKVAGNYAHNIGILSINNTLFSWGRNNYGQLGLGVIGSNSYVPQSLNLFEFGGSAVTPGWRYPAASNFWGSENQANLLGATGNYFDIAEVSLTYSPTRRKVYFPSRESEHITECKKYYTILSVGESSVSISPVIFPNYIAGTTAAFVSSTNEKSLNADNYSIRKISYSDGFYSQFTTPYRPVPAGGITGYYTIELAENAFTRLFHNTWSGNGSNCWPAKHNRTIVSDENGNRTGFDDTDNITGIDWNYGGTAGYIADQVFAITGHTNSIFSEGITSTYPSIPNYNLQRYGWDSGTDILNYFKYPYGHRGPATPTLYFISAWNSSNYGSSFVESSWLARIGFSQVPNTTEMYLRSNVYIDSEYTYGD